MDAISITGCIQNSVIVPGLGSIGIQRHATLLRLYLKTCTWLRMENKLVTAGGGRGTPLARSKLTLMAETLLLLFFGNKACMFSGKRGNAIDL